VNRSTYPLKLPDSIKRAAQRLAREDGVSLNQWIAVAVAQKVGVTETANDFFARRSHGADPRALLEFLRKAPDRVPEDNDALPHKARSQKSRSAH
jgi:hypothetical protein